MIIDKLIKLKWIEIFGIAILYFLAAKIGLLLQIEGTNVSPVWPPSGLAFAILFLFGKEYSLGIFIGAFVANIFGFENNPDSELTQNIVISFLIAIGNTLEAFVGLWFLNKLKIQGKLLDNYSNIFKLIFSVGISCAIAAIIGSTSLLIFNRIDLHLYPTVLRTWYLGDFSGLILFSPTIIVFYQYWNEKINFNKLIELTGLGVVIGFLTYYLFIDQYFLNFLKLAPYLIIPLLLWSSFRFGNKELLFFILIISLFSIIGTIQKKGSFFNLDLNQSLLELEFFILIITSSFLALKSTLNGQINSLQKLEVWNKDLELKIIEGVKETYAIKESYEEASKTVKLGYWEWDVITNQVIWSKEMYKLFEVPLDKKDINFETYLDMVHEDDRDIVMKTIELAFKEKRSYEIIHRIKNKNSFEKWIKGNGKVVLDENKNVIKLSGTALDISELKQQENLANQYKTMVQGAIDPIFSINLRGEIDTWNNGARQLFGYEEAEIIGKNYAILAPKDKIEEIENIIKKIQFNENLPPFETVRKNKKGDLIEIEETDSPIKDSSGITIGIAIIARDNTFKKQKEEQKFKLIVESAPNAMILINKKGIIELINGQTERLFGYTRAELIGKSMEMLLPEKYRDIHPTHRENFHKNPQARSMGAGRELYAVHKSGYEIPVEIGLNPIQTSEELQVLASIIDISERKKIEEKNSEVKLAEESIKMKDRFLANMSHEIRTPMNAIIGFSDLLARTSLTGEQAQFVKLVKSSGENLLTIINDILDFSKIEAGKLSLEKVPINISNILLSLYEIMQVKAADKNIELKFNFEKIEHPFVLGDSIRLSQILMNLISNAIKFTEKGKVELNVSSKLTGENKCEIIFEIKDSGIGIDKQNLESIFERFHQAESDITRKFGGTGLGLSITKNIVDLHNGTIAIESTKGEGSTFTVTIPYYIIKKEEYSNLNQQRQFKLKNLKSFEIKILLVEDNILNQKLVGTVLNKIGVDFELASNGRVATEILSKKSFSLILMDLQMPEMDGYEATNIIRNTLKLKTPILAMTAHALAGEKDKCIELGMNDYLSKPFKPVELITRIITLCKINLSSVESIEQEEEDEKLIDLDYLKENTDNDKELINQMVSIFIFQAPKEIKNIRKLFVENKMEDMAKVSHKMKSTVSIFGLKRTVALLNELELFINEDHKMENVASKIDLIESDVNTAILELRDIQL